MFLYDRFGAFYYHFTSENLGLGCPFKMEKTVLKRDFFIQKLEFFS